MSTDNLRDELARRLLLVRRRDEAGPRQLAEAGNDDVVNRLVDLLAEREDEGPA
jgi:hypothetical protein